MERLIWDGKLEWMACVPSLPEGHPRIVNATREELENMSIFITGSTGCWRRYQGTWEIKDGRLYLRGLYGRIKLVGEEPLFADWVTDELRVVHGKTVHYVHMGFASDYEDEIYIKIEKGIVVCTRSADNRGRIYMPWD